MDKTITQLQTSPTGLRRTEFFTRGELMVRERGDKEPSRTIAGYAIVFGVPSVPLWEDEHEQVFEVIDASAVSRELLDRSDIKMTMFHDRQLMLARSKEGEGTLSYSIDDKGVAFEFEAPNTVDGDKALELVRRGDISGCSFAFSTDYSNREAVSCERVTIGDKVRTTYTVRSIAGIYDFTLAADPAYEQTGCAIREMIEREREAERMEAERVKEEKRREDEARRETIRKQIAEMRLLAGQIV